MIRSNEYARVAQSATVRGPVRTSSLSEREIEILRLVADGRSNGEIADALSHTEGTVKQYIKTITMKLGARGRTHAAILAKESGLI